VIAFFWAALIVTALCVAIGAIICIKKFSALTAAGDRLSKHPLFVALRTASASSDKFGHATASVADAWQKFDAGARSIGDALSAVAMYAAFVSAIAKSVDELLEVFVPTLRGRPAL
jgi:hypothetical protein